jgi:hypothetical protein
MESLRYDNLVLFVGECQMMNVVILLRFCADTLQLGWENRASCF